MNESIEYANKHKLRAIFLEVRTDNTAAIQLYRKKGFEIHSIKQNYYKDGIPDFGMVLKFF